MSKDLLDRAKSALESADWEAARAAFEEAAAADPDDPRLLVGLSDALWWQGDWVASRELREKAYARHRAMGARVEAARAAVWLANEYLIASGNRAAWNGWLERAASLLESVETCAEHGWLVFARGRRALDPVAAEAACFDALKIARQFSDVDLEVVTLSQLGRALVAQGRIDEGFAKLDEAMAAVMAGEPRSYTTVCDTCCNMLTTCEGAGELERLAQWCKVTDEMGRRFKGLLVYAFCRLNYASVLIAMGRLAEAEKQVAEGLEISRKAYPAYVVHYASKLAEVCLVQGRVADAEDWLRGHEESPPAVRALAILRLAKGEPKAAAGLIARRLGQLKNDVIQSAPLLSLLVEARIESGDADAAHDAACALEALADATKRATLIAAADLAQGMVALAREEESAWARLDRAHQLFVALEMKTDAARARLAMARALAGDDLESAREGARAARAEFLDIGATREADRAAEVLRELGVGAGPGKRTAVDLSARELEVLDQLATGASNAEIGKRLFISGKTVEHHVGKILSKLGLKGRAAAAAYATKHRKNR